MRSFFILPLLIFSSYSGFSQQDSLKVKQRKFYFTWGYTKSVYSKSTIHLRNHSGQYNPVTDRYDNYDFTIYNATAHDRPDYDKIRDVVNITIPQFVGRLGYQLNDKWGVEINYDHTKYVVDDYQKLHVKGEINNNWIDQDTLLDPDSFLHFEHTDGANFWMINAVRRWTLYQPGKNFRTSWVLKPGAGVVIPRTEVWLFGQKLNNNWKLAGWIVGVETGLRVEFLKRGIFEFVTKGTYADYVNAFILGRGHGRASHHFFTGQLTATLGWRFGSR
jgi:hypothetical protein